MPRVLFQFCQILLILIVALTASTFDTLADEMVKRKILALYDGAKTGDKEDTLIHRMAEMPLNHIGYDVRYVDVQNGLPDIRNLEEFAGVITWFAGPVKKGEDYLDWAANAAEQGLKFLIIGDIGVRESKLTLPRINRLLAYLGVRLEGEFFPETAGTIVQKLDDKIIGFERPLPTVFPPYNLAKSIAPDTTLHLSVHSPAHNQFLRRFNKPNEIVLITSNGGGGFVQAGFANSYEKTLERYKWIINPFTYFKKVYGSPTFPIPDTTTLSGRRIYFSHVDGDGWNNISLIEKYKKNKTLSSEVMLRELIAPYPNLPVTIGLVTGDLDATIGGNPDAKQIARDIYALDQVEIGSHTHTHPFKWGVYKAYSRKKELDAIEQRSRKTTGPKRNVLSELVRPQTTMTPRDRHLKYIAGSDNPMPRVYMKKPYDVEHDITASLRLAESYAPEGKRAKLLQWSGDTMPFENAIKTSRRAGVRNINGGDSRFDGQYSSIAYVSPISRMVGSQRQIYAAASNENTYTNDWTGPYYGFHALTKTLENTESPRRLKPFNLYYHTYSAERYASLRAIKQHLERARDGSYAPIAASHYAAIADSFFEVEIKQNSAHNWLIHNRGDMQTMRFDNANNIQIDLENSRGVLGTNRHSDALYIALDATVDTITIATKPTIGLEPPARPSLLESRWQIEALTVDGCNIAFSARGFGPGQMTWRGMVPGPYQVSVERNKKHLWQAEVEITEDGNIQLEIPVRAIEKVDVTFMCGNAKSTAFLDIAGSR